MSIIKWIIRTVFWLQAFVAPVILFGLIALWVASRGEKYSNFAIVLLGIGVVAGIIVAEYIRRKIGLETFFARIYEPNEMDEKLKKKKG
jgi:hypothetical protein